MKLCPIQMTLALASTLGVSLISLTPSAESDLFVMFSEDMAPEDIREGLKSMGLSIVEETTFQRHLIVDNPRGDAVSRLYRLGADLVIDARFARFCSDEPPIDLSTQDTRR